MPAGLVIPSIFTAVNRFSGPVRAMESSMRSFIGRSQVGIAHVERGFRKLLSPLNAVQNSLRGLGVYVGLFSLMLLLNRSIQVMARFEQAQVNIAAVTGKSVTENKMLANQARILSLRYGEAAESVLALDLSLIKLGYNKPSDIMQMSKPIATGAVALQAQPEDLAKTTGAALKAWKMPASQTGRLVDMFAKAADLSALDWSDLQTMMPRAMQSAALAGMQPEDLVSLFAIVRDAQVHTASGSTAIKNMLIKGAIYNKSYTEMLDKIIASPNSIKAAFKMFGSKTLVTALPLAEAQKLGGIEKFKADLIASSSGYAERVAGTRLNSTLGRLTLFKRSYEELVLAVDEGNGPVAAALKNWLDTGRAMLLIAAGSEPANTALAEMNGGVKAVAAKYLTWLKIAGFVVASLIAMKIALVAVNLVMGISRAILAVYYVAWGIYNAITKTSVVYTYAQSTAMYAQAAATWFLTLRTRLLNLVMTTTPLGWAIIGFGLLAAAMWRTSDSYKGVADSAKAANAEVSKTKMGGEDRFGAVNETRRMMGQRPLDPNDYNRFGIAKNPLSLLGKTIVQDVKDDFGRLKNFFMPDFASMSEGYQPIDLNSVKQEDWMKQLQVVQSGNMSLDINNNTPYPASAKSSPNGPKIKMGSTFKNYNYGE